MLVGSTVTDTVEKRVVRGPTLFIPAANEWLHEFAWHGSDPADKGRLVKGSKQFTKLRTVPVQTQCYLLEHCLLWSMLKSPK